MMSLNESTNLSEAYPRESEKTKEIISLDNLQAKIQTKDFQNIKINTNHYSAPFECYNVSHTHET
jgi:hypothetical protein